MSASVYRLAVIHADSGQVVSVFPAGGPIETDLIAGVRQGVEEALDQTAATLDQQLKQAPIGIGRTRNQVRQVLRHQADAIRPLLSNAIEQAVFDVIWDLKRRVPPL